MEIVIFPPELILLPEPALAKPMLNPAAVDVELVLMSILLTALRAVESPIVRPVLPVKVRVPPDCMLLPVPTLRVPAPAVMLRLPLTVVKLTPVPSVTFCVPLKVNAPLAVLSTNPLPLLIVAGLEAVPLVTMIDPVPPVWKLAVPNETLPMPTIEMLPLDGKTALVETVAPPVNLIAPRAPAPVAFKDTLPPLAVEMVTPSATMIPVALPAADTEILPFCVCTLALIPMSPEVTVVNEIGPKALMPGPPTVIEAWIFLILTPPPSWLTAAIGPRVMAPGLLLP